MLKVTFVLLVNNIDLFNKTGRRMNGQVYPIFNADQPARALNEGIEKAKTDIVVLTHQDVFFPKNWVEKLEEYIDLPNWGVIGLLGWDDRCKTYGHVIPNFRTILRDPTSWLRKGYLPHEVTNLDPLCLIIRKSDGLRFDEKLGGWHFYGADICFQAIKEGFRIYAIDNPVRHLGAGVYSFSEEDWGKYNECKRRLIEKWPKSAGHFEAYKILENTKSNVFTSLLKKRI